MQTPILDISNLSLRLKGAADRSYAVKKVELRLYAGETLCLVGESGSGKSLTSRAILGLLPEKAVAVESGSILFEGRDLLAMDAAALRGIRGKAISMIFQEPMTALNPVKRIGDQISEVFRVHTNLRGAARQNRVVALLEEVNLPDPAAIMRAYPHQLSGGQRQRAMIAMALALSPKVVLADEPTTALDVTTQAQILKLLRNLRCKYGSAVLFVTHDFGVVAEVADRVAVMRQGRIVEVGTVQDILQRPRHPYTKALIAAIPRRLRTDTAELSTRALLTVRNLSKTFGARTFSWRGHRRTVKAVNDVALDIRQGRTLGVVGESGSGKSTLARLIVRLESPDTGQIHLDGMDILKASARMLKPLRKNFQMVFQDPYGSLNPRKRVGAILTDGPRLHGVPYGEAFDRACRLLEMVELGAQAAQRYPHEFSGGQRQRICIARALALQPRLLIADEAVSALDVSVQRQILDLLANLQTALGLTMIFVTHDLRVAAQICDEVVVMHQGVVVEHGPVSEIFGNPKQPYTKQLLASIPGQAQFPLARFPAVGQR